LRERRWQKNIFAAGVKTQILAHPRPPCFEKPDQPAVMVEMSVAEDQCVHSGRVDFQQFQIVGVDAWGEPKVQQVAPRLAAPRRFDVQRQTPLAFERLALRHGRESHPLNGKTRAFQRSQEYIVGVVRNLLNDDTVDDRHIDREGDGPRGSPDPGGHQGAAHRSRGLQETPSVQHDLLLQIARRAARAADSHFRRLY
jgi:hypothetical protein